jgi:hypothetical protein
MDMKTFGAFAILSLLLVSAVVCPGCGKDETTTTKEQLAVTTLLTGLEYPTGLWVKSGRVYFTETNGRNTAFGGKVALSVFDTGTSAKELILNDPANSDAVVMDSDGDLYLTSWHGSIPGDFGKVSVVDTATKAETNVTDLEIASVDMFMDVNDDIFVIGSSDNPSAKSVYRLPNGSYASPEVVHQSLGRTRCMSIYNTNFYYSDDAKIRRFVGGIFEDFAARSVRSMTFSSTNLYYADYAGGKIGEINLSSNANRTLYSGLQSPTAVRWDPEHRKLYFLEAGTEAGEFKDGTLKVITGLR